MSQLQRYKMVVAYRGTAYHGWQEQSLTANYGGPTPAAGEGIATVQQCLRRAIGEVVGHPVVVCGSSRTDAGVHAKGQVAHFDTTAVQIPPLGMMRAVNARLPGDIVARSIEAVGPDFNAISSTRSKRYQYLIWTSEHRNVFIGDRAWHFWRPMDVDAMQAAAAVLVGEHDFASFAKPGHGRQTTVRTLLDCSVQRRGHALVIGVEGTGFLWNMVRIIVGTLVEVGAGKYSVEDVSLMLKAAQRTSAGRTAPAHGLYLQWIRCEPPAAR